MTLLMALWAASIVVALALDVMLVAYIVINWLDPV